MAGATAVGTGSKITFSGFTGVCTGLTRSNLSRPAVRSSHLTTTTWDTFLPGKLSNPGTLVAEVQIDTSLVTEYEGLITATAQTLTMSFALSQGSDTTQAKVTASAFVTDIEQAMPLEEMMTGSITFQLTGTPTSAVQAT